MCEILYLEGKISNHRDAIIESVNDMFQRNSDGVGFIADRSRFGKSNKLADVIEQIDHEIGKSSELIIHTRLKTHGDSSMMNIHPVKSGRWAVIHNGIMHTKEEVNSHKKASDTKKFTDLLEINSNIDEAFKKHSGSWSMFILDKLENRLYYTKHSANFEFVYMVNDGLVVGATKLSLILTNFKQKRVFKKCFVRDKPLTIAKFRMKENVIYEIVDGSPTAKSEYKVKESHVYNSYVPSKYWYGEEKNGESIWW